MPSPETAQQVDKAIFDELVRGTASDQCRDVFRAAIAELAHAGARSVVLGNTDLTLIADDLQAGSPVPLIDGTTAHAREAARVALSGEL